MSNHKFREFLLIAALVILGGCSPAGQVSTSAISLPQPQCEVVVLAKTDDPYYPLAADIAAAENAPLTHTLAEAMACQPEFLILVASPAYLSDEAMIDLGEALKQRSLAFSPGIITGSTIEMARALWERRVEAGGHEFFAVNAPNPAAHIDAGQIITYSGEFATVQPLTKADFLQALGMADYLTFTGHGSVRYLRLDEETTVKAADVPPLQAAVVSTGSCQTLQPWKDVSISRRMVDQGAAAYTGFVFSPNEGYLIGEFDGLALRYTWPEFPIGHAIQVQNRGTIQGFARFPFQFILGDPRLSLQDAPAYHLTEDRLEVSQRILTYRDVPAGVIPIRIAGGAAYHFVKAPGITASADQDPFYNSKLQMINIREDKFILLIHPGGDLTLQLSQQPPLFWFPADILLDSLDHTLIFSSQTGGDVVAVAFSLIPLAWAAWMAFKKHLNWRAVLAAAAFGVGAAILQGMYALIRLDQVTITSKVVVFSPLSIAAAFLLIAGGALIYFYSRRRGSKIIALLVITFASWAPAVFGLLILVLFNLAAFAPRYGTSLYNYFLGLLPALSFLLTCLLSGLVLRLITRRYRFL